MPKKKPAPLTKRYVRAALKDGKPTTLESDSLNGPWNATKRAPRKHTVESLGRKLDDLISRAEKPPAALVGGDAPGPVDIILAAWGKDQVEVVSRADTATVIAKDSPPPKRESELEAAINRLWSAIGYAESTTEAEAERLAPILLPGDQPREPRPGNPIAASHLAYRLHDLADRLATDNSRRRDLLARLDLPEA